MRVSNISSSQIELFVRLAEAGSFSEAAQRLGLTQSAVSHGLARLETELGVVLVERGRRGVTLTPAGRDALPHAREALARLEAIRQVVTAASGGKAAAKLRVGIAVPLSARLTAGIHGAFRERHPEVEITLRDGGSPEVNTWVAEGAVEIAILADAAPGLETRPFAVEEVVAVVPHGHRWAARDSVPAAELFEEPLIVPRFGRETVAALASRPEGATGRPAVRHLVNDTGIALALVRAGMGSALLPRGAAPEADGLLSLPLQPPVSRTVAVAARSWDAAPPAARHFAAVAEAWARENGFGG